MTISLVMLRTRLVHFAEDAECECEPAFKEFSLLILVLEFGRSREILHMGKGYDGHVRCQEMVAGAIGAIGEGRIAISSLH